MNIRQKLAELRNLAREGGNVDAAELIALQTQVQAEEQIAELAAEGERTRAEERAAREKAANIATAQETARDLATTTETDLLDAWDHLVDAIEAVINAADARHDALVEAVTVLSRAGAPAQGDDAAGSVAAHNSDTIRPTVYVDGKRHFSVNQTGDFINAAINAANYRFKRPTGEVRRLHVYGGSYLLNMLPVPNWSVLPADRRP